ncbi:hypothetical protein GCM10027570_15310 [Streptomonospora sediminis]
MFSRERHQLEVLTREGGLLAQRAQVEHRGGSRGRESDERGGQRGERKGDMAAAPVKPVRRSYVKA